ncbi:hypothetical protein CC86DRAFT_369407 [Ophiobolus disseminans]|uniref:Uncharacterized protein n=1 Tax=Ophiobolus disseminans TaxID=1469910 RepID=A0A6A7A286_9PLEO|nr:hypothetical protein CC86DRAFT_369407 [Ophiobolus disseminans]
MYRLATSKIAIYEPTSTIQPHNPDLLISLPNPATHTRPPQNTLPTTARRLLFVFAVLMVFALWLVVIDQPWIWSMYIWKTPPRAEYYAAGPIID